MNNFSFFISSMYKNFTAFWEKFVLYLKRKFFIILSIKGFCTISSGLLDPLGLCLIHLLLLPFLIYWGVRTGAKLSMLCPNKIFYLTFSVFSVVAYFSFMYYMTDFLYMLHKECMLGFMDPRHSVLLNQFPPEVATNIYNRLIITHYRRASGQHVYISSDPQTGSRSYLWGYNITIRFN